MISQRFYHVLQCVQMIGRCVLNVQIVFIEYRFGSEKEKKKKQTGKISTNNDEENSTCRFPAEPNERNSQFRL